ncbi:hypothetical protein C8F04DRAFT_1294223 [Mycena alexandri]|uniref:Uncharacterized protein n=1 Tax=Mycena alexandri TaxID=1745969 RepID=A0AAD6WU62_9AGAR|nr:hypothetical protein C8F04DRAFT_1294223 [Mycena alexandri]
MPRAAGTYMHLTAARGFVLGRRRPGSPGERMGGVLAPGFHPYAAKAAFGIPAGMTDDGRDAIYCPSVVGVVSRAGWLFGAGTPSYARVAPHAILVVCKDGTGRDEPGGDLLGFSWRTKPDIDSGPSRPLPDVPQAIGTSLERGTRVFVTCSLLYHTPFSDAGAHTTYAVVPRASPESSLARGREEGGGGGGGERSAVAEDCGGGGCAVGWSTTSDMFLHEEWVAARTYAICAPSTSTTARGRWERRWAASGLLPRRDAGASKASCDVGYDSWRSSVVCNVHYPWAGGVVRCGGVGEGGVCRGGDGGDGISMLVERPRSDGWIIEWESTARCQRLRGEVYTCGIPRLGIKKNNLSASASEPVYVQYLWKIQKYLMLDNQIFSRLKASYVRLGLTW